jgi:excisionase family DNA binding protein
MPRTPTNRTVLPPEETGPLSKMLAVMNNEGPARLVGPDGTEFELPAEAYRVLHDVLAAMSKGLAITLVPRHTMLTTQEAADLLGISRPTVVKLITEGEIAHEQRGRHRRLLLTDVLAYQERARTERKRHLDEMVDEAGKHDLYAATATPQDTR